MIAIVLYHLFEIILVSFRIILLTFLITVKIVLSTFADSRQARSGSIASQKKDRTEASTTDETNLVSSSNSRLKGNLKSIRCASVTSQEYETAQHSHTDSEILVLSSNSQLEASSSNTSVFAVKPKTRIVAVEVKDVDGSDIESIKTDSGQAVVLDTIVAKDPEDKELQTETDNSDSKKLEPLEYIGLQTTPDSDAYSNASGSEDSQSSTDDYYAEYYYASSSEDEQKSAALRLEAIERVSRCKRKLNFDCRMLSLQNKHSKQLASLKWNKSLQPRKIARPCSVQQLRLLKKALDHNKHEHECIN